MIVKNPMDSVLRDGGPVSPIAVELSGGATLHHHGISVRQLYAAHALGGIAQAMTAQILGDPGSMDKAKVEKMMRTAATLADGFAAAMIRQDNASRERAESDD